ncbi:MAG: HNH endonuclease [bacterium]
MAFPRDDVAKLLAACHRRCCICHRYCGVKIETDHIVPSGERGSDDIENAIPVCFECHAEIHSYNDKHPRGRKFTADELRAHKEQWLRLVTERPEILLAPSRAADVGPLQALIDELEFNEQVGWQPDAKVQGCPFRDEQFGRAIREGAISTLDDNLKKQILSAYVAIGRANQHIAGVMAQPPVGNNWAEAVNRAARSISAARNEVSNARGTLLTFLASAE